MLDELDIKILVALYKMKFNYGEKINFSTLGFENNQHAAYHLLKLRNLEYIEFNESDTFHTGGRKHEKYNNNVLMIWPEKLDITPKGIEEVKNYL